MRTPRTLVAIGLAALIAAAVPAPAPAAGVPNDPDAVRHALNRLTFGPRPDDVERVRRMGLSSWIDGQLNPSKLDDAALDQRLQPPPDRPDRFESMQQARMYGRQSVQVLAANKVIRAVYSERQLEEVLVDFWFNHFNVFAGKGRTSLFLAEYERDAIRPHVLGKFRDLLGATAKSPAMLFYLDNWLSVDPEAADRLATRVPNRVNRRPGSAPRRPAGVPPPSGTQPSPDAGAQSPDDPAAAGGLQASAPPPPQQAGNRRRRGLNENYGRELLELHTLGVDGGYTQKDVIEVARALTGWTIGPPDGARRPGRRQSGVAAPNPAAFETGVFRFVPALHDTGDKMVLGHRISGGGVEEGERVLDILAAHPATARHIARQLAQRFVSDTPPDALVGRLAKRFTETGGDLREVLRALVSSPEFFAPAARQAKVKKPIDFVASAFRATGRELDDPRPVLRGLQQLGEMPYMCQPPTGYDDAAETWINAGALVARMNIAQQIAGAQAAATIGGPEFQRR